MNAVSQFDPQTFLDATTTEAQVKRPPLPAGSVLIGTISEITMRAWQGKKDPGQSGVAADLMIDLDLSATPDLQSLVGGLPKITVKDGIMLDLNDGGMIDWGIGKNGKLRRYREALGMNTAGQPFNIRQMQGRQLRVKVKHRPYEGELYEEVDSVAKM